jgi:hypothetical protein
MGIQYYENIYVRSSKVVDRTILKPKLSVYNIWNIIQINRMLLQVHNFDF